MRRIVVAITGASGSIYGLRTLEVLAKAGDIETHLIVSRGAATTVQHELERPVADITALADVVHDDADLAASVASGSFRVDGRSTEPMFLYGFEVSDIYRDLYDPDAPQVIDAAVDRNLARQPIGEILAGLDTLDERIATALLSRRRQTRPPAQTAPAAGGGGTVVALPPRRSTRPLNQS